MSTTENLKTASHPICGARTRSGGVCQARPVKGSGLRSGTPRCRMHGGTTPSGVASPAFRTGKYSKVMPARLVERYEAGVKDPELLALRKEIALVDARIEDLLTRVDSGEAGDLWRKLRATYKVMEAAQRAGDIVTGSEALVEIGVLINRGLADYAAWDDLGDWLEKRRKLAETEAKRLVAMEQMVTAEQASALVVGIQMLVHREIKKQIEAGRLEVPVARALLMGVSDGLRELAHQEAQAAQAALPAPTESEVLPA